MCQYGQEFIRHDRMMLPDDRRKDIASDRFFAAWETRNIPSLPSKGLI